MNTGDDQLLDEFLDSSAVSEGKDDGTLDALCRLMERSTTQKQGLMLLLDFQHQQMAKFDRESDQMMGILDTCSVSDLKYPDLFAKPEVLANFAQVLRIDIPTKSERVGKFGDVKAEAVKAPLKEHLLLKETEQDCASSLKSLGALSKTEGAEKIQAVQEPLDLQGTEKLHQKNRRMKLFVDNGKPYSHLIDIAMNSILEQESRFEAEISLETLLAMRTKLDRIREEELAPIRHGLDDYKGMHPYQLLRAKLAKAQARFYHLEHNIKQRIADMQI